MSELEKFVSELNEKVRGKKGEIAFCLREFQFGKEAGGGFLPPETKEVYYYETGIINGEFKKNSPPAPIEIINFPALFLEHYNLDEYILGEYSLPVNRKLKGFFMHDFHKDFQFEIKDLEEQLKQGQLFMNSREFAEIFSVSEIFYPGSKESNFKSFSLLIGDKETEDFMKKKEIDNYPELFNVLKKPEYVKEIIDKHYSNERERIAKKLIILANEIANNFREIKSLEAGVMHAHSIKDWDADGKEFDCFDKEELVNKYFKLKKEISNKVENRLNKYLEKGGLYKELLDQEVNGEVIGFPEKISFSSYATWLKNRLIPDIYKTFENIDGYLKEKNKKAMVH